MNLFKIINQENSTLVDVREPYEFAEGHAMGAINIPLSSIAERINEFEKMSNPIVVYCRSGARSAQAKNYLKTQGFTEVYNGGGVDEVISYQKQAA